MPVVGEYWYCIRFVFTQVSATPETWTEGIALLIAIVGLMFTSPIVFTGLLCRRAFSSLSPPLTHCTPGLSGGVLCILWLKE